MRLWEILSNWQEEGWKGIAVDKNGIEYDFRGDGCVISTYLDEEFTIKEEKQEQEIIVENLNVTVNSANLTTKEFAKSIGEALKSVGARISY